MRRSSRKSKALQVDEVHDQDESEQVQKKETTIDNDMVLDGATTSVSKRSTRAVTRESKKKRSEDLRSKSVGLVGKIDTEQTAAKKIIFRNDELADVTVQSTKGLANDDEALDDDDDDDNVEEVKASVAKEQVLGQMQQERKTAIVVQKIETKRKRKAVHATPTTDDAMDAEFFAKLDAELDQERRDKKQAKIAPKGKKTTFVSRDETDNVVERDHNISVVVLGAPEAVAAATGTKPSHAALVFSRSKLQDGISTIKKTGISKKKPAKKEGWKRSQKTTRILASGRKQRRSKPAAHFVIKV